MIEETGMAIPEQNELEERTIQTVTFEIKSLHAQAQQVVLGYAIEIGRRLTEAKTMLEHGEWGNWLKDEVRFSKSTANNLMRIYDEFGDRQLSFFGAEAKSQALGSLPYTKALKLLAIPEEEREEFIENHDVEEMSTRELEKVIKERDKAEQAEEDLRKEKQKIQEEKERLEQEAEEAQQKVLALQEKITLLQNTPRDVAVETVVDQEAIETAMGVARAEVKGELLPLVESLEEAKQEAERKAQQAEEALKNLEEKQAQNSDHEEIITALERDKEELEKKLSSIPTQDVAIFKVHFTQTQDHLNQMLEQVNTLTNSGDTEDAEKLRKALITVLETTLQLAKNGGK